MVANFYLEKRTDKNSEHPIKVSVCIKGTRLLSTLGYNIAAKDWKGDRVKQGVTNASGVPYSHINLRIKKIDTFFSELALTIDHKPTIDELANHLAAIKGSKRKAVRTAQKAAACSEMTMLSCFDEFVRDEGTRNQWTDGTRECMAAFRNHLQKQGDIDFSHFNEDGITRFIEYLRTECGMGENTIQKHYGNLRWFLNWCIRKGLTKEDAITRYKPKFKIIEKPVVFLTRDELLTLYSFKIPDNGSKVKLTERNGKTYEKIVHDKAALEKTRDLFCFCAFTSLRYSDMAKLKRTDIVGGHLNVTTQKTNDKLTIELNDYSKAILDKYKDCLFPNGLALPVISNQKMNGYIKELGELCGFNEPVSWTMIKGGRKIEESQPKWAMLGTHCGRKTFICYALSVGIPPQVVMKWTGHSDYKAMRPYIDIAEQTKAEAMKLFNITSQTK